MNIRLDYLLFVEIFVSNNLIVFDRETFRDIFDLQPRLPFISHKSKFSSSKMNKVVVSSMIIKNWTSSQHSRKWITQMSNLYEELLRIEQLIQVFRFFIVNMLKVILIYNNTLNHSLGMLSRKHLTVDWKLFFLKKITR